MIDLYYKLALFGTNTPFIILASIFVLFYIDKNIAINTLIFSFLSIFINQYLKSIWQIPMDPSLNKVGWAFPSGHAQLNIVFWGCLLWQLRSKFLAIFLAILLPSSYFGMIDAKYHTWLDIWGGVASGSCIIFAFVLWHMYLRAYIKSLSIAVLFVCVTIFALLPEMPHKFFWLWFYLGSLMPVILVIWVKPLDITFSYNKPERIGLFFITSMVVTLISTNLSTNLVIIFIQGFFIGFSALFLVPFLYGMIKSRVQK